jgi:predicted transcriptional regulator
MQNLSYVINLIATKKNCRITDFSIAQFLDTSSWKKRRRGRSTMTQNKKYRSRTEIICDILQIARSDGNGVVQTKIMYSAFLSYHQVKEYLTILIGNDLLQHDLGNQRFRITEKGVRFLQLCDQIGDLIEVEES